MIEIPFQHLFFDNIVKPTLGYTPKIKIKPTHLANGLFRAIYGTAFNSQIQHEAIYTKGYPDSEKIPIFLQSEKHEPIRYMLFSMLAADRAVYKGVRNSSYTLSHATHITADNHDRGAGEWLYAILAHDDGDGPSPALTLLHKLLTEKAMQRSDELSILTLPLLKEEEEVSQSATSATIRPTTLLVESLELDASGSFRDPLLKSIRAGFDQLALHEKENASYGGKLDALHRLVTWGCFSVYLHLANSGIEEPERRIPIVLCSGDISRRHRTLEQASIQSYQWVKNSIDLFFRPRIEAVVDKLARDKTYGTLEGDEAILALLPNINWSASKGQRKKAKQREKLTNQSRQFYLSYRSDTSRFSPTVAFAHTMADLLNPVLSTNPSSVGQALGTQIGLISPYRRNNVKLYQPTADLLDVFVRAAVPKGAQWSIKELAAHWAKHLGVQFGALGNENELNEFWNIRAVDRSAWVLNSEHLVSTLELSGYARRYADGVVLVSVKE